MKLGREYPPETVWQAQELYCVNRLTYRVVARQLGVAESTLKRWADKYGWRDMRERLAQAECDIRADTVLARASMIKHLLDSKDPQAAFAVASLEKLAMKQVEAERAGRIVEAAVTPSRSINTPEEVVAALREAVEVKLSLLLASPADLDFRAVSEVQKALKLVAEMEAEVAPATEKPKSKGISAESANRIKELLGYKI